MEKNKRRTSARLAGKQKEQLRTPDPKRDKDFKIQQMEMEIEELKRQGDVAQSQVEKAPQVDLSLNNESFNEVDNSNTNFETDAPPTKKPRNSERSEMEMKLEELKRPLDELRRKLCMELQVFPSAKYIPLSDLDGSHMHLHHELVARSTAAHARQVAVRVRCAASRARDSASIALSTTDVDAALDAARAADAAAVSLDHAADTIDAAIPPVAAIIQNQANYSYSALSAKILEKNGAFASLTTANSDANKVIRDGNTAWRAAMKVVRSICGFKII